MDTSVGSPRSSSGYGSSEEDHICLESMTSIQTGNNSEPTTPDSLSPLSSCDLYSYSAVNSPVRYGDTADPTSAAVSDFRFVFDDDDVSIPDLADLEVLQAAASAADLYNLVDDWSTVTTPPAAIQTSDDADSDVISPVGSIPSFNSDDLEMLHSGSPSIEQCSPGNILVSLLKLPKSELDNGGWLQTFQTSSSSPCSSTTSFLSDVICSSADAAAAYLINTNSAVAETSSASQALGQSEVVAMTTPLQRLKALTQDQNSVVNDTDPPCRPMIVGNRKLSNTVSSSQTSSSKHAVPSPTLSAVSNSSIHRTSVSNQRPIIVSGLKNSNSKSSSPLMTSCLVASRQQSTSSPTLGGGCGLAAPGSRKQSQTMTSSLNRHAPVPAAVVRRHYSELDDHRYSTLLPVPPSTVTTQRKPVVTTTCGATKRLNRSISSPQCRKPTGTSILETFLLTNKTLKPNEGSEASLAACGVWMPGVHGNSAFFDGEQQVSEPESKRPCSDLSASTSGSLLEHLLTSRSEENKQKQLATATTSTAVVSSSGRRSTLLKTEPPIENDFETLSSATTDDRFLTTAADSFGLFGSEHLLYDSQSMNLGALFGDDMLTSSWTPSCFDDKVSANEMDDIMQQQVRQDEAWLQHYLTDLL